MSEHSSSFSQLSRIDAINAFLLAAVLAFSMALVDSNSVDSNSAESPDSVSEASSVSDSESEEPNGAGTEAPQRVVSASSVSDHVLAELIEPGRVVAISAAASEPATWRFAELPRIARIGDIEAILAVHPDLVFASALGGDRSVARLREAGVRVVELGDLSGFDSLLEAIRRIGEAVHLTERTRVYIERLEARRAELAAGPELARGIYISVFGARIFGGTAGSSFGDVLAGGGMRDIAPEFGHHGWPAYSNEELLTMNPDWMVVAEGDDQHLCAIVALAPLSVCHTHQFVTLPSALLSDPGPRLLDAAALLRRTLSDRVERPRPNPENTAFHD